MSKELKLFLLVVPGFIEGWHGGLPPTNLVAFVIFGVGYLANLVGRK